MTRPAHHDDRLRTELRDLAFDYRPDRAAIARRAAAGRVRAARRDRMRPVAVAAGVLGVVAAIGIGVQGNAEPDVPPVAAVAPSGTTTTRPPAPAKPRPEGQTPAEREPAPAEPQRTEPTREVPPPTRPADTGTKVMTCRGTIDENSAPTWTQNTVTMRTTTRIDTMNVTITVPRTAGIRAAGRFTTAPNSEVDLAVEETADALVYRFWLKDGAQLPAGTWVFAAQFDHGTGRDGGDDSYVATAAGATKAGNFSRI